MHIVDPHVHLYRIVAVSSCNLEIIMLDSAKSKSLGFQRWKVSGSGPGGAWTWNDISHVENIWSCPCKKKRELIHTVETGNKISLKSFKTSAAMTERFLQALCTYRGRLPLYATSLNASFSSSLRHTYNRLNTTTISMHSCESEQHNSQPTAGPIIPCPAAAIINSVLHSTKWTSTYSLRLPQTFFAVIWRTLIKVILYVTSAICGSLCLYISSVYQWLRALNNKSEYFSQNGESVILL